jgi:hypothetical protein
VHLGQGDWQRSGGKRHRSCPAFPGRARWRPTRAAMHGSTGSGGAHRSDRQVVPPRCLGRAIVPTSYTKNLLVSIASGVHHRGEAVWVLHLGDGARPFENAGRSVAGQATRSLRSRLSFAAAGRSHPFCCCCRRQHHGGKRVRWKCEAGLHARTGAGGSCGVPNRIMQRREAVIVRAVQKGNGFVAPVGRRPDGVS